jgi:hypothetical protein
MLRGKPLVRCSGCRWSQGRPPAARRAEPRAARALADPGETGEKTLGTPVFIDIFRSPDLSGWAKALWFLFVLFIPLIGVLAYLIARGGSMHQLAGRARP